MTDSFAAFCRAGKNNVFGELERDWVYVWLFRKWVLHEFKADIVNANAVEAKQRLLMNEAG